MDTHTQLKEKDAYVRKVAFSAFDFVVPADKIVPTSTTYVRGDFKHLVYSV